MRPPRLVLLLVCFVALPIFLTFFSLLYSHPRRGVSGKSTTPSQKPGLQAFFSFYTPTLFPPSAIISLTDDNSTFFLAKPADFGPLLPADGLSGQLWVGSGFGDVNAGRGGVTTGAEGELGCTDVPGWVEGNSPQHGDDDSEGVVKSTITQLDSSVGAQDTDGKQRRSEAIDRVGSSVENMEESIPQEEDGTDDYLHHPLPGSQAAKPNKPGQSAEHEPAKDGLPSEHADIQSLQESAEIAGKVVILSRGGCGFLEKVKWTQRRGGVALIVGDYSPGGPLLVMYAKGDTSNVTIPSLFTSHTTAHLLSSLIPPGGMDDDNLLEDGSKTSSGEDHPTKVGSKKKSGRKSKTSKIGPSFTPSGGVTKPTGTPRPSIVPASGARTSSSERKAQGSWLRSLASAFGLGGRSSSSGLPADSRRPPSSGRINWIISDNWNDEPKPGKQTKSKSNKPSNGASKAKPTKVGSQQGSSDDFVIGVQDWRDPDLVAPQGNKNSMKSKGRPEMTASKLNSQTTTASPKQSTTPGNQGTKGLTGGSITPGSGEYQKPGHAGDDSTDTSQSRNSPTADHKAGSIHQVNSGQGWLSRLIWGTQNDENIYQPAQRKRPIHYLEDVEFVDDEDSESFDEHDGLWVTLTPTTISTSPFFDTLLVLVVSPLVTLTVVYALLLLRSRIRRRRWRAPKSVVDRLPVRTYHTMSYSSSSTSSHAPSPIASSPTSPLLTSSPRSMLSRSRPRSRTTSGIGDTVSASLDKASVKAALARNEKVVTRKRYNGKQVECVVCLEEYVDGQSRVMRLPCGHEFHAECM